MNKTKLVARIAAGGTVAALGFASTKIAPRETFEPATPRYLLVTFALFAIGVLAEPRIEQYVARKMG